MNNSTIAPVIKPHLKDYCPASNLALNEEIRKRQSNGETIYHLAFGQSPFPVVEGAQKKLSENADKNAYQPVAGILELRQAICDFHAKNDNLQDLDPNNVIVGPGSKELIFLLLQIYNADVMIPSPAWTTYRPQVMLSRNRVALVPTSRSENWRITPDSLEKVITENKFGPHCLLILCNPDNPTGVAYEAEHLKALSKMLRKYKVTVLSDEIYARLHFDGNHDTLVRYYPEGTILSTGISKWASCGGWRLGYHIYPSELGAIRQAVASSASHTYSSASAPIQYAAVHLFNFDKECQTYVTHCRKILKAVGTYTWKVLTSVGVKAICPQGGFYIFPDFEILRDALKARGITTCDQMCQALLNEARVAVMAGGPAFLRPLDEFTVRLCFINFDGTAALKASIEQGDGKPITEEFLQQHCLPTVQGIQAIKKWVEDLLASK